MMFCEAVNSSTVYISPAPTALVGRDVSSRFACVSKSHLHENRSSDEPLPVSTDASGELAGGAFKGEVSSDLESDELE